MDKPTKKLEQNVSDFITKCSKEIELFEADMFEYSIHREVMGNTINSPLEQILYCALQTIRQLNSIPSAEPFDIGDITYLIGLGIFPQIKISKYRCDFQVSYYWLNHNSKKQFNRDILVECDSQEWHERAETERRYEKKRDRYLLSRGYKVFHFTGSEIIKEPFGVAAEIISFVTEMPLDDILLDNNLLKE